MMGAEWEILQGLLGSLDLVDINVAGYGTYLLAWGTPRSGGGHRQLWRIDRGRKLSRYNGKKEAWTVIDKLRFEPGDVFPWDIAHWQSDWNGDEVGYSEDQIVGLYSLHGRDYYMDMDTNRVLEVVEEEDE